MESKKHSDGYQWAKFFEHWGVSLTSLMAILAAQVVTFFMAMSGASWVWFFAASFALIIFGGCLILCAKLPVYRSGRFFTFGVKSVPHHLAGYYRWGWRVFLFGVVIGLCLLISRP